MNTAERNSKLERATIIEGQLPCIFNHPPEYFPADLKGSRIVTIGTVTDVPDDMQVEGGGLAIEYIPEGSSDVRRLVLGFNEIGMWVEHVSPKPSAE